MRRRAATIAAWAVVLLAFFLGLALGNLAWAALGPYLGARQ